MAGDRDKAMGVRAGAGGAANIPPPNPTQPRPKSKEPKSPWEAEQTPAREQE